ncbi:MAG: 5-oxoprolinase subunit PxpA [Holophaga sp.]|jgi:UPF0271 protein
MIRTIDLNCDLGESFGAWRMGQDEAVLDWVTSANIACGFHAGDPPTMARTVRAAVARGVALGAHPSWPDLQGFGRRSMAVPPGEAHDLVLYQLGALAGFVRAAGGRLRHVKPHGSLYNQAACDPALAQAVAQAVRDFEASLILVGPSGSELIRAGRDEGLTCASEVFADRGYRPDGSLVPRSEPGALIEDPAASIARVLRMAREGLVVSTGGTDVAVQADTVCIHGDHPGAAGLARSLRQALAQAGIPVRALQG